MEPALAQELGGIIFRVVFYVVLVTVTYIPSRRIFRRVGLSTWWAVLSLVPVGMIVILWIVAFRKWPNEANAKI